MVSAWRRVGGKATRLRSRASFWLAIAPSAWLAFDVRSARSLRREAIVPSAFDPLTRNWLSASTVAGQLGEQPPGRRQRRGEVLVGALGALRVAVIERRRALDHVAKPGPDLGPEGVEELVEVDRGGRLRSVQGRPVAELGRVVGPRGERDVAVRDPRQRGGADDRRRSLVELLVDRDRDIGLGVLGQADVVDGADRLSGHQDLVSVDELTAVLEQQVVRVPARPSEQDHEHEDEADQQSPAAGNSGDPRAAPGTRRLPFRRHRSGAACPLLCASTGSGSVLRESSSPPPAPDISVRARDSPGGILFLAPLRGGDQT